MKAIQDEPRLLQASYCSQTIVHTAVALEEIDILKALIEHDPEFIHGVGGTPLHTATAVPPAACVKLSLDKGARTMS
jgi:hypothetical protein